MPLTMRLNHKKLEPSNHSIGLQEKTIKTIRKSHVDLFNPAYTVITLA